MGAVRERQRVRGRERGRERGIGSAVNLPLRDNNKL